MVEIISKRSGPRPEDARMRQVIDQNRSTIVKIADQISNGGYSASRKARKAPEAQGLIIHVGGSSVAAEPKPAIRISVNGRVICVDNNTARQLHHIGELRYRDGRQVFVLATKANGFFAPVDVEVSGALADLDGRAIATEFPEDALIAEIRARLGITA